MKALVLTGRSQRHRYFAHAIADRFEVPAVLTEEKRKYYGEQRDRSPEIRAHFERLAEAEARWFGTSDTRCAVEFKPVETINSEDCVEWATAQNADLVCLFGTAILGQRWLEAFPSRIVNLHLGMSPFYRGAATLFWPFVNRELQHLGATIHLATDKVDAGGILARIDADLRPAEDYYAITSRLIRDAIDRFPEVATEYVQNARSAVPQEPIAGRVYRKSDFTEQALVQALGYVGDGLSIAEIARIEEARSCRYSR